MSEAEARARIAAAQRAKSTDLDLSGLRDLKALLTEIRMLSSLTSLECSGTQVSDLEPLRALSSLYSLHCADLEHLRDVPSELVVGECSQELRGYVLDLEQGAEADRAVRALFVGNGVAGKSTLDHCLVHGAPPARSIQKRTHAIVSQQLPFDDVEVRLWDFAGQDIYHATHRLFLKSGGVFVLVWTEAQDPLDPTPNAERHPPAYWLTLIQQLGGRVVIAVQNKSDLSAKRVELPDWRRSPKSAAFRSRLGEPIRGQRWRRIVGRDQRASTVVTTNLPFKDWGKLFNNSAAASAIADRLVHRGLLVQISGKSRRSDRTVDSSPPEA